ncbi:insulinase family protein [Myxococcota bacterium]|nr:insulinase family protein [Myxococcota bacterium]
MAVAVKKRTLSNGLVVLVSPEPGSRRVLVDVAFRAGALYEPRGKSGLAHLVEHLMVRGPTPETNYLELLERRKATRTNAFTQADRMTFRTIVPAEELSLALWVAADRMVRLPGLLDAQAVERERKVVLVERAMRLVDRPYGLVDTEIDGRTFPSPHPLHGQVIGTPEELAQLTLADVQSFVARHLTPVNAVVTIVGNVDEPTAFRLVEDALGAIPAGTPAIAAGPPRGRWDGVSIEMREARSSRPRVSLVWRLDGLTREVADALELGAAILSGYIDGAFGTEVDAGLDEVEGWGVFRLDITLPYDKPVESAAGEAEAFLRYLTATDLPYDAFEAGKLAIDRSILFGLDGLAGRASLLTHLELRFGDPIRNTRFTEGHWRFARHDIQHIAWKALVVGTPRLEVHARPLRPAQAKPEWEARE